MSQAATWDLQSLKAVHESKLHGKCPINGRWDYYDVVVTVDDGEIEVGALEEIFDSVRGAEITQEEMAGRLGNAIASLGVCEYRVELFGRHSQNTGTTATVFNDQ